LVLDELRKKNDTWEDFLAQNQFGEPQEVEKEPKLEEAGVECEEAKETS
jgi:hypothetical protein